jgi:hypothetical protein
LSSLTAIRAGLAANLSSRIKGTQVSAYWLANPTPPCLEVFPDSVEGTQYHQAMVNGLHRWNLAVRGMVQNNEAESAQRTLDKWLADTGADSASAATPVTRNTPAKGWLGLCSRLCGKSKSWQRAARRTLLVFFRTRRREAAACQSKSKGNR